MPRISHEQMPVAALERAALGGALATNRWLQPEMLGCSGLLDLQAGPRRRLGLQPSTASARRSAAGTPPDPAEVARRYPQEAKRERPYDVTSSASSSSSSSSSTAVSSALLPGWFVADRFDDRRAASRSLRVVWRRASDLACRKRCRLPRRRPRRPPDRTRGDPRRHQARPIADPLPDKITSPRDS